MEWLGRLLCVARYGFTPLLPTPILSPKCMSFSPSSNYNDSSNIKVQKVIIVDL